MAFCASVLLVMVVVFTYGVQFARTEPWKLGFEEEPADTQFAHTQSAFLRCKVVGNPAPTVSWRLATSPETTLTKNTSLRYVLPNGSLFFPPFREEDLDPSVHLASYQCVARNTLGAIVSRKAKLSAVVVEPYHVYAEDTRVVLGGTAVIKAVFPKSKRHYVRVKSWYKGRDKVNIGGRYSLLPSGDLIITSMRQEDTAQMYYCYTVNILTGDTEASNPAKIFTRDQTETPAYMTSNVFNVIVTTGETAQLQCTAGGYPAPQYSWTKQGGGAVTMGGRFSLYAGGSLRIERVLFSDGGMYTCIATNSGGTITSVISLEVRVPLTFRTRPQPRAVQIGTNSVQFNCDVTGEPRPNITWYRNTKPIPKDKEERISISQSLIISIVYGKDMGIYQCVADNGLEMIQSSAEFYAGVRPPLISTPSFQEQILNPGDSLDLECKVSTQYLTPKITWYLDGNQLHDGKDYKITVSHQLGTNAHRLSRLQRSSMKSLDGGRYKCVSSNEAGSAEHAAFIHVRGAPNITFFPRTVKVVQGRSLHLPCKVKGYPVPVMKWMKGSATIPYDRRQHITENGTLIITNVQKNDMGSYTCTATNTEGQTDSATLTLNVQVLPTIRPMKVGPTDEGNQEHLTCGYSSGDTPIEVYWMRQGKRLGTSSRIDVLSLSSLSVLTIKSAIAEDAGMYTCVANNSAGTVRETAEIIVYVPPKFTETPANQFVLKGQLAFLSCPTTAYPPARIDWSKNVNNRFEPVGREARFKKLLNGTLIISNITEEDEGQYVCTAKNGVEAGEVSKNVIVTVHVPASIVGSPPDRSIEVNSDYSVTCVARGNLPITLLWYRGTNVLSSSSRVSTRLLVTKHLHTVNSTLHIRNLELQDTSTAYSCRVQNTYGSDSKYFSLTVQEKPKPPKRPTFQKTEARSVLVSWEPGFNGNAPLIAFHVEYKLSSDYWRYARREETGGAARSLKLVDLKPDSRYDVRLYAENGLGESDMSDEATVETKEDAPSKPPVIVNVTAISSREIYVEWRPPAEKDRNGEIRGYYVVARQPNRPVDYRNKTVKGGSRVSYIIGGLAKYTEYKILVQAFTRGGVSPSTEKVSSKTQEDVPSKPPQQVNIIILSSTSMKVTWKRPPKSATHGILIGFKVHYWKVDNPVEVGPIILRNTSSSVLLQNLRKFTKYKVTVLAFTRKGDGIKSKEMEETTAEDMPGSPSRVRAIPDSKRTIRVIWNPPLEPNGIILNYKLVYYTRNKRVGKNSAGSEVTKLVDGDTTSHFLRGLEAHATYYFWVQARTSVGYGNKSAVIEQKTRDEVAAGIYYETLTATYEKFKGSAVLECEAYGEPEPTIIWYSKGRTLKNTDKYDELKNGSLVIRDLKAEDSGEYECTATNTLGTKTVTKTVTRVLKVQVPPSPPHDIRFFNISSESMNITWKAPLNTGNCDVLMYMLEYKVLEPGKDWEVNHIKDKRTFYILRERLTAGQKLVVSLSAVNCAGLGEKSTKYKITFAANGIIMNVGVMDDGKEETFPDDKGGGLGHSSALLGTLVGISTLIIIIIILLVLLMARGRSFKILEDAQKFWQKRVRSRMITRHPRQIEECSRRSAQGERAERHPSPSPSSEGHLADSSSSVDHLASCHSSQFSIPRSNSTLHAPAHIAIPEDSMPPPQPLLSSITPNILSARSRGNFHDDSLSDTSSENPRDWGRPIYHRPIVHENESVIRARRFMGSTESYNQFTPVPARPTNGTPGLNALAYRGHADGGSEFDTTSLACGTDSRGELRRSIGSRQSRGSKVRGLSQEIIHASPASGMARTRDSSAGPSRHDLTRRADSGLGPSRSDISSRLSSVSKREPLPRRTNDFTLNTALVLPNPGYQSNYPDMKKDSSFPRDVQRTLMTRGPRSYDSTSSEYSSSRDELVAALEYGKRNNLEAFYGKPTLETTSMSSETTNSSEQDSVCKFTSSPRPPLEGCLAPVPVRPPPYNPRSRSRGNENYVYVLDPRRRGIDRDKTIRVKGAECNGSLV